MKMARLKIYFLAQSGQQIFPENGKALDLLLSQKQATFCTRTF